MTTVAPYGPFVSRDIARERGYKRYYVNQPCLRGHVAPRNTKTANCSECENARRRKDPNKPIKHGRRALTPQERHIQKRISLLHKHNFSYWGRQGSFVYCYLRSKDLTPYYVGIAFEDNPKRPIQPHNVVIPKDRRRIRLLRTRLTWQEACKWERFYIKHYGRQDRGTGILRNRTDGGEGRPGWVTPEETKQKLSDAHKPYAIQSAKEYKIPTDFYLDLEGPVRSALKSWLERHPDKTYLDYFERDEEADAAEARARAGLSKSINVAKDKGVPVDVWLGWSRKERGRFDAWVAGGDDRTYQDYLVRHDKPHWATGTSHSEEFVARRMLPIHERAAAKYEVDLDWYLTLSVDDRDLMNRRYRKGSRGKELTHNIPLPPGADSRQVDAAERFDVPIKWWMAATTKMRNNVRARWYRGKRGKALYEDLISAV